LKDPAAQPAVDDSVDYNIHVENTGAATIDFINLVDTIKSGDPSLTTGTTLTVDSCTQGIDPTQLFSLAAGASVDCTVTYKTTQHDVDTCKITNTATAAGYWRTPGRVPDEANDADNDDSHAVSATWSVDLTLGQAYSIELIQTVDPSSASVLAGSPVTFTYQITNHGNTNLTNVKLVPTFGGDATGTPQALNCDNFDLATDTLAPGQTVTCTLEYDTTGVHTSEPIVTPAHLSSVATVTANPPADDVCPQDVIASNETSIDVIVTPIFDAAPAMVTMKTATPSVISGPGPVDVTYTITVTNPGNTDLRNITVSDDDLTKLGVVLDCGGKTSLAARSEYTDWVVCTGTHTFTDSELASAKTFVNVATVTADSYHGNDLSVSVAPQYPSATVYVARISLAKDADVSSVSAVGDVINYTFTVTNTGAVDLTGVAIDEGDFTSGTSTISPNPIGDITCNGVPLATLTLAPDESVVCTASYVVQQRDLDGGYMENHATATGSYYVPNTQSFAQVSDDAQASVDADQNYALTLDESVSPSRVPVGGQMIFTYTITNTGNVSLTNLTFSEPSFTGNGITLDIANMACVTGDPAVPFDLSDPTSVIVPGQVVVCTLPAYATVAADLSNPNHAVISNGQIIGYPTSISVRTTGQGLAGATATGYVYLPNNAQTGGSVTTSATPIALVIGLLGMMAVAVLFVRRRGLLR